MRARQKGLTLIGLIFVLFILFFVALLAMKLVPSYMEYGAAKNAINAIARDQQGGTVADIRRSFDARSAIDDINVIKATDLEITKDGNQVVIGFAYRKEVPLFANVGVYIDYAASTRRD